ncbi:hypothetical protein MMC17_008508 [Xylographa soralifera]|nr:hypothetical protein [Xylographa soralifera]
MFQQFPDEILLNVFQFLKKSAIKRARLVCRKWAFLPIRFLFDRVFISYHNRDLDVFTKITGHPVISASVTEIIFGVIRFDKISGIHQYIRALLDQLEGLEGVLRDLKTISSIDMEIQSVLRDVADGTELIDDGTLRKWEDYRIFKRGHSKYVELYLEQETNRDNMELQMRLCIGLKSLSRLRSVRFSNEWDLDDAWNRKFDARKLLPSHINGSPLARSWHPLYLKPSSVQMTTCTEFFLVVHALYLANTEIKSLGTVSLAQDTFSGHNTVRQTAAKDMMSFAGLEIFDLHMIAGTALPSSIAELPRILQSMTRLKILTIDLNDNRQKDPALYSLGKILCSPDTIFPQLTTLELKSMKCDSSDLTGYLRRLPKLTHLGLHDIELTAGNWTTTFDHMRRFLTLRILDLGGVLREEAGVDIWQLVPRFTGMDAGEKIQKFVLHGGENPMRQWSGISLED